MHYGSIAVSPIVSSRSNNRRVIVAAVATLIIGVVALGAFITSQSTDEGNVELFQMLARGQFKREKGVPKTVVAPPPEPADWDGSVATMGKMPPTGLAPSALTEIGFETRGSITVRRDLAAENEYYRIYGRINHHLKVTLREYRKLGGEYNNEVIYTGFKRVWTGTSEIQTGHLPRDHENEFDVLTIRDLDTGEVQYFQVH